MQRRTGKIVKRTLLGLLAVIAILVIVYWELIVYGIRQGKGQLTIVWNARPVEEVMQDPTRLAAAIKSLPLTVSAARPLDEAISSAGGVRFSALDGALMLRAMPGVFCAGEMLDWEAPTGGYLLTACLASGRVAGLGALGLQVAAGQRTTAGDAP